MGAKWRIFRLSVAWMCLMCSNLATQSCTSRDNNHAGEFANRSQRQTIKGNKSALRIGKLDAEEESKIEQTYQNLPGLAEADWPQHSGACVQQASALGAYRDGFPELFARLNYHSQELGSFASASQMSEKEIAKIRTTLAYLRSERLSAFGEIVASELNQVPDAWRILEEINCHIDENKALLRDRACAAKELQAKMETHSQYQYLALSALFPKKSLIPNYEETGAAARLARRIGNAEVLSLRRLARALNRIDVSAGTFAGVFAAALTATQSKIAFLKTSAEELNVSFDVTSLEQELITLRQRVTDESDASVAIPGAESETVAEEVRHLAKSLKAAVKSSFSRRETRDSARSRVVDLEELLAVCLGESDTDTE